MTIDHNVYIGRYIKLKSRCSNVSYSETIQICSNDVDCKNHFSNKDLTTFKFCPECGSKVVSENVTLTKQVAFDVEDICEELFDNSGKFYVQDNGNIFYNSSAIFAKHLSNSEELDLTKMFEYMNNKTVDDAVDILSKHLTKIGVEHEVKFAVVGYYW